MSTMNLLRIIDLRNGRLRLDWQRSGETHSYGPLPFHDPLTEADHQELRWYLEEYLSFPYGAERERAARLEQQQAAWGEALFYQVFEEAKGDHGPRTFYREAAREGLQQVEVCVESEDDEFLRIPWELLRDPTPGRGFLALLLAGVYRQRSSRKMKAPPMAPVDQPFRILLVISRPYGERDVPLGTVARPVLDAVRGLRPYLELDLLRPPTFDALQQYLNTRPGYYQLVHFDGHGTFLEADSGPPPRLQLQAGRGHLVFERPDGTPHVVNSAELGQALEACGVPLFVLNACQSAQEGRIDPYGSVAAQLVASGAYGVVAMSYSVYPSAAACFMRRFYDQLAAHASLAGAVTAGRQALYSQPHRPSVAGVLELRDWLVPVVYQRQPGYVPIPPDVGTARREVPAAEVALRQRADEVCPPGRFGFVGRDYDLFRLERGLRDAEHPWALLSGMGGAGKTDLARGFARWCADTGGCPGGVFAASFRVKADFGQVVGSIAGYGSDFSRLSEEERWRSLVEYLRAHACLLVCDNFEPVAGYPEGAEPLASQVEREQLARFLRALRGGKSRVLLTTRKLAEDWLGIDYQMIELGGLTERDAAQMAQGVLRTVGRQPEDFHDDPDYARLVRLLRGHPRSLELVLPQLCHHSPRGVIEALQQRTDQFGQALADASLEYAFSLLSECTRRHLPFLGLFASYVHVDMLGRFVASGEQQRVYTELLGESLDASGWEAILVEAGRNGFLQPLGGPLYALHPTLPVFLRGQLAKAVGETGLTRLDGEFARFYASVAGWLYEGVRRAEPNSLRAVDFEEANLVRGLRLAEAQAAWAFARDIAWTLAAFYKARGRSAEWAALRASLLRRLGRDLPEGTDRDQAKANLWVFLLGNEANAAVEHNELAAAEAAHLRVLDYLLAHQDSAAEHDIAWTYLRLGVVAMSRRQYDRAEAWCQKALAIYERPGQEHNGEIYFQLGRLALERGQHDRAEEWYRKALAIGERLGLEWNAAATCHSLGVVAWSRGQHDQAQEWYQKALAIHERLGLEAEAAADYHTLGKVEQLRGRYDQAEEWYRKALAIRERLGLELRAAHDYQELGVVARWRGQYVRAAEWYRKALATYERLGHPSWQVEALEVLGQLCRDQNQVEEAISWLGQALIIATAHDMRVAGRIIAELGGLVDRVGEQCFSATWKQTFPDHATLLERLCTAAHESSSPPAQAG